MPPGCGAAHVPEFVVRTTEGGCVGGRISATRDKMSPVKSHRHVSSMVAIKAPAKLTATLEIVGTRPDGYHLLDALTAPLQRPHDVVSVTTGSEPVLAYSQQRSKDPSVDRVAIPGDVNNLAVAAALAMFESAGSPVEFLGETVHRSGLDGRLDRAWHLGVDKRIPAGGGLGGGSADAGAVIRLLGRILSVSETDQRAVAAGLGSDVPICWADAPMYMRGVGDVLNPAPRLESVWVVVTTPPLSVSTPEVYRMWDQMGGPVGHEVEAPRSWRGAVEVLRNDLEPAAHAVCPALASFADELGALDRPATLAGSGASYVVWARDAADASVIADTLRGRTAVHAWVSEFPAAGGLDAASVKG